MQRKPTSMSTGNDRVARLRRIVSLDSVRTYYPSATLPVSSLNPTPRDKGKSPLHASASPRTPLNESGSPRDTSITVPRSSIPRPTNHSLAIPRRHHPLSSTSSCQITAEAALASPNAPITRRSSPSRYPSLIAISKTASSTISSRMEPDSSPRGLRLKESRVHEPLSTADVVLRDTGAAPRPAHRVGIYFSEGQPSSNRGGVEDLSKLSQASAPTRRLSGRPVEDVRRIIDTVTLGLKAGIQRWRGRNNISGRERGLKINRDDRKYEDEIGIREMVKGPSYAGDQQFATWSHPRREAWWDKSSPVHWMIETPRVPARSSKAKEQNADWDWDFEEYSSAKNQTAMRSSKAKYEAGINEGDGVADIGDALTTTVEDMSMPLVERATNVPEPTPESSHPFGIVNSALDDIICHEAAQARPLTEAIRSASSKPCTSDAEVHLSAGTDLTLSLPLSKAVDSQSRSVDVAYAQNFRCEAEWYGPKNFAKGWKENNDGDLHRRNIINRQSLQLLGMHTALIYEIANNVEHITRPAAHKAGHDNCSINREEPDESCESQRSWAGTTEDDISDLLQLRSLDDCPSTGLQDGDKILGQEDSPQTLNMAMGLDSSTVRLLCPRPWFNNTPRETATGFNSREPGLNILVLGSGAREHALADKLAQSPTVKHVYVAPGNAGTHHIYESKISSLSQHDAGPLTAKKLDIGLVVVGSHKLLMTDIGKLFAEKNIPCLAPHSTMGFLERPDRVVEFNAHYNIPNVFRFYISSHDQVLQILQSQHPLGKLVIKTTSDDGHHILHSGALEEAKLFLMKGACTEKVFIAEEYLKGEEIVITAIADGKSVIQLPVCRLHSRLSSDPSSTQTKGMGAIAMCMPEGFSYQKAIDSILISIFSGLWSEAHDYRGALSIRIILASDGPKVIQYRLGFPDPETQTLLQLLSPATDFAQLLLACANGTLDKVPFSYTGDFACSLVVMNHADQNQHKRHETDHIYVGKMPANNGYVFHDSTEMVDGKLKATGERVFCAVGVGSELTVARRKAMECAKAIDMRHRHFRKDIGASG